MYRPVSSTQNQAPIEPDFPNDYLGNGYFNQKGQCHENLIIEWPRLIANKMASKGLKTAQLRRFYGEVKRIQRKIKINDKFEDACAEILKLDAFAAEAVKKNKAPSMFGEFFRRNVKLATKDKHHFNDGFVRHFESIVAYFP